MFKRVSLLVLAGVLFVSAGIVVHQNYRHAQALANDALIADHVGGDSSAQVATLKHYVASHLIGTSLKLVLTDSFERAQDAARASAAATAANAQVYADAQRICSGKSDSIVQARCNQEYLNSHLVALPASGPISTPQLSDYSYTFTSPLWYPDLAGGLALAGLILLSWTLASTLRRKPRGVR